jgi:hypothetical protein
MELAMDMEAALYSSFPSPRRGEGGAPPGTPGEGPDNHGSQNDLQHRVRLVQDFIIPEPQDAKPLIF